MNWENGSTLKESYLSTLENLWKIVLPPSFKDIIKNNNKGYPGKNVFDTAHTRERVFGQLLDFDLSLPANVLCHYDSLKDILPSKHYPFAIDPGGSYLCFDYSNGQQPKITYWNHEGVLNNGREIHITEFVAESFDQLISILYRPDMDDINFSEFKIPD